MFNSKFNNVLTVILVIAIILIIALICFLGYSLYNKYYINKKSQEAMDLFDQQISDVKPEEPDTNEIVDGNVVIGDVTGGNSIYSDQSSGGSNSNPVKLGGYDVIGKISIPKIDIEYPILNKSTPNSLKLAITYLSGPGINKAGNTVLQGHNYKNGLFFSNLSKLSKGDAIYITDSTGTKIKYEVYDNTTKRGDDASFYNRDTGGLREINLSTCTTDVTMRTVIFAREVTE